MTSLVALGTPHGGSPWPDVEGFIGGTTSLVLNNLTAVAWPAKVLGYFVRQARSLDKALPELRADSDCLKLLGQSSDPKLTYTLLAGNTSKARPPAPPPGDPWYKRFAESLSISDLLHRTLSIAFLNEANDIAVSVSSASKVDAQRQPAPVIHELACDHLSYFSDKTSTELLWKVTGIAPAAASVAAGQPKN